MDMFSALSAYYGSYDEDGRLRSRHGMVEFLTTMRYIEVYLKPGMRVLEIGAATGRYSHALARMGYCVDAVDLIPHNIDIFIRNTTPEEQVTILQADARDLSMFCDESYDITLLLGPMYHLIQKADQIMALKEALRVTKKGGIVFASYCGNDATILQFCFGKGELKDPHYQALIDPVTFKATTTPEELFQLYRVEDIDELMQEFCVKRLHFIGTDMATNYMRTVIDEMDDAFFELYLRYHFTICERKDMVGVSHHFLDVFQK